MLNRLFPYRTVILKEKFLHQCSIYCKENINDVHTMFYNCFITWSKVTKLHKFHLVDLLHAKFLIATYFN